MTSSYDAEAQAFYVEDGPLLAPLWVTPALCIAANPGPGRIGIAAHETFGGGAHPTTRLLLEALAARARAGSRLLDAGTGSGVLALVGAALRMRATGLDKDPAAIARALANRDANGLGDVRFAVADLARAGAPDDATRYHLVLANLYAPELVACLPWLAARVDADGILVASGVLLHDSARVESAAARVGLALVERTAREGWARLSFAPVPSRAPSLSPPLALR